MQYYPLPQQFKTSSAVHLALFQFIQSSIKKTDFSEGHESGYNANSNFPGIMTGNSQAGCSLV
jgi:hypothetical protein